MKGPFLVSFSGMDGSGKTQLVVLLRRFFRRQGITYLTIHSVNDSFANRLAKRVPTFRNLIKPKVVEDVQNSKKTKPNKKISTASCMIRMATLVLDALYLRFRLAFMWGHYDVIILDRYIYDRLIQIAYLRRKKNLNFGNWVLKLFPRPNLPLYLHVMPQDSMERKKEVVAEGQDINYFQTKYNYFEEAKVLWKLLMIDNSTLSLSESKKKMLALLKKRYFRYRRNANF